MIRIWTQPSNSFSKPPKPRVSRAAEPSLERLAAEVRARNWGIVSPRQRYFFAVATSPEDVPRPCCRSQSLLAKEARGASRTPPVISQPTRDISKASDYKRREACLKRWLSVAAHCVTTSESQPVKLARRLITALQAIGNSIAIEAGSGISVSTNSRMIGSSLLKPKRVSSPEPL